MAFKPTTTLATVRATAIADDVFRLNLPMGYEAGRALADQIERAPSEGKAVVVTVAIVDAAHLRAAPPERVHVWTDSQTMLDEFNSFEAVERGG
jgi:hypothetical protein